VSRKAPFTHKIKGKSVEVHPVMTAHSMIGAIKIDGVSYGSDDRKYEFPDPANISDTQKLAFVDPNLVWKAAPAPVQKQEEPPKVPPAPGPAKA
jgi:hypothetical protein